MGKSTMGVYSYSNIFHEMSEKNLAGYAEIAIFEFIRKKSLLYLHLKFCLLYFS
jgi:hypothetical protein